MLPRTVLNVRRAPALLLAACLLLAGAAGGGQPGTDTIVPLDEAVRAASAELVAPPAPPTPLVVGLPQSGSLLDGYVAHMLTFHLSKRSLAAATQKYPVVGAAGVPECLLVALRAEGAATFLQTRTDETGPERRLLLVAWDVKSGEQHEAAEFTFHLPSDLRALVEGQRASMRGADKRWLRLFDRLFPPAAPPADSPRAARLAAADFFFASGVWPDAARRYLADPEPDAAFLRGVFALQLAGQWEEAEAAVQDALSTHFDSGPLYALWGWLAQRERRAQDAVMFLNQARLTDMSREGLYVFARGLVALEQGDIENARQNLTRAAEMLPDELHAQVEAGRFHWDRGEIQEAIRYLRRATAQEGCPSEVWAELALLLEASNEPGDALSALERAFSLDQSSPVVTRQLAALLRRTGQHERALDVLRRAAEANPCSPALLAAYGDGAVAVWRIATAEQQFEKAARLSAGSPHARVRLADILALQRRYGRAQAELTAVLAESPEYAPARISLGRILAELGRPEEAITTLREVTRHPEHEVAARLALAEVYIGQGQAEQAVRETQIAVSARADAQTYAALCDAFLASNQVDKAATAAQSALAKGAAAPEARLAEARVHLARGQLQETLEATAAALERNPYMFEALRLRGAVRREMGQIRDCAALWQRALALNEWAADLHFELSRLLGERLGDHEASLRHYARYLELERKRTQQTP